MQAIATAIVPGVRFFIGSSSSPTSVFVTRVEGDLVHFKVTPIEVGESERRLSRAQFAALADHGCRRAIQQQEAVIARIRHAEIHGSMFSNTPLPVKLNLSATIAPHEQVVLTLHQLLAGTAIVEQESEYQAFEVTCTVSDEVIRERGERDGWGYVDSLTGGSCISMMDGQERPLYVAHLTGLSRVKAFAAAKGIEVVESVQRRCRKPAPDDDFAPS